MKYAVYSLMLAAGLVSGCATPPPPLPPAPVPQVATAPAKPVTDHVQQGLFYINQKDYPNAVREFKSAVASSPTADAYSNLGAVYMKIGKKNLAMDALKSGERMNARHPILLYNLAALHSINDDTDLSLEYIGRALDSGFSNFDALRSDADLINVRSEPEFRHVLEQRRVFLQ